MGRPPIGKRAMTSSERQRRYLERLRDAGIADLRDKVAALQRQLDKLRRRMRLERDAQDGDET